MAPVTKRGIGRPTGARAASVPQPIAHAQLAIPIDPAIPLSTGPSAVVAISSDGSRIVFVAEDAGTRRLYLRPLDVFGATAVPGTEGASNPFFSPDGEWIGFQAGRQLQKVAVGGGLPLTLCEVADLRGACWTRSGTIIYAPGPATGLWLVQSTGGAAAPLTTLAFEQGERTHRWPHALPDGRGVIFTVGRAGAASFDEAALAVTEIGTPGHRLVVQHATDGRYLQDGHLVWARGGALLEAAFDLEARQVGGPARIVLDGVSMSATGVTHAACSDSGVLVHVPGEAQSLRRSLVAVNRAGTQVEAFTGGDSLEEPRMAPDGRSAIISLRNRTSDLWLYEFGRGSLGRLTFEGENFAGIWGPGDGTISFGSGGEGPSDIFTLQPDRSAPPERLVTSEHDKVPGAWSPGGATLVFTEYHPETGADIWVLERDAARVRPLVRTKFNEYAPVFSPDGRWIAYVSDESGRPEILVVSYPEAVGKRQLSTEGGTEPLWARDGTELFYRSGDRLMRVDMSRGPGDAGIPTTLFEGRYVPGTVTLANYDVAPNGAGFLMVVANTSPSPTAIRVTLGWRGSRVNQD
ncbi:MAG TPA: hypothetical protein VNJ54_02280 [Plantibacter sp.]|uniref:hypothetical protein n=1 Tax=Plantibacter sp. TaxID=1871045 RepID=UPI002C47355D|nr:hypothetical protein [Plantibacter sp.]